MSVVCGVTIVDWEKREGMYLTDIVNGKKESWIMIREGKTNARGFTDNKTMKGLHFQSSIQFIYVFSIDTFLSMYL